MRGRRAAAADMLTRQDSVVIRHGMLNLQIAAEGHSLVFETGAQLPAEALFLDYAEPAGPMLSPEVFPRADGTTYVCGGRARQPFPSTLAGSRPTRARSIGSWRCAPGCRPCSPGHGFSQQRIGEFKPELGAATDRR